METNQYGWFKIAEADGRPLKEKELRVVKAGTKEICLTRWEGDLYAFSARCPHAGGCLSNGYVDGRGNVVCPVHGYRYRVKGGYNSSSEGFRLVTYPLERREDGLYARVRLKVM